MKSKYLIDTNILIYYFNGLIDDDFINKVLIDSFNISVITKIEFLSWPKLLKNEQLYQKAIQFISNAVIYNLDEQVIEQTITNRQNHNIPTPDAIIGSTAFVNNFALITNNIKDFDKLSIKIKTIELL